MIENDKQLKVSEKIVSDYEIYRKELVKNLKEANITENQKVMALMPSDVFIKGIQEEIDIYKSNKTKLI